MRLGRRLPQRTTSPPRFCVRARRPRDEARRRRRESRPPASQSPIRSCCTPRPRERRRRRRRPPRAPSPPSEELSFDRRFFRIFGGAATPERGQRDSAQQIQAVAVRRLRRSGSWHGRGKAWLERRKRPDFPLKTGGATGDRTPDLRIANAALSQLSYCPKTAALPSGEEGARHPGNEVRDHTPAPSEVKPIMAMRGADNAAWSRRSSCFSGLAIAGDQRLREEPPAVDGDEKEQLEGKAHLRRAHHLHP
jgi:hypothetical protein